MITYSFSYIVHATHDSFLICFLLNSLFRKEDFFEEFFFHQN